jgi:hypothetical protein
MTFTRRGKATLLSALAFGAAFAIYAYVSRRPEPDRRATVAVASGDSESVNQGRSLGRKLADVARAPGAPPSPSPSPTHRAGPTCDKCTADNCAAGTDDGCDSITDAAERKACEELYACFASNGCVVQGDPLPCWCGKNMTTCVTDNSGATQANGPCVREIFAAAKSSDADTVFKQFLNTELPIGRAVRLTSCRGNFCANDCKIP